MAKVTAHDAETGEVHELRTPFLDDQGREVLDPRPMAPPIGYVKQPSLWEQMRAMIRDEISRSAQEEGFESFEEADDFEMDDLDPTSPYEEVFEPEIPASPPPLPESPSAAAKGSSAAAPPSEGPGSRVSETPSPAASPAGSE